MRKGVALFALLLATSLFAAEPAQQDAGPTFPLNQKALTLVDGRVFPKWVVLGETPSSVTIGYPGGMIKVDKKLLPESLREIYKVDPAAIAAEAKADAERKAIERQKDKDRWDAAIASNQKEADRIAAANAAAAQGTTVTRGETHVDSSRTVASEASDVAIPAEAKRQSYVVEYEILSNATALDLRYGQNGANSDIKAASVGHGWTQQVSAKTGDRLYFSAQSNRSGGEEFTVRIKVDGRIVKEAIGRGTDSLAEVTYTIP
jgi:hypothetical protein